MEVSGLKKLVISLVFVFLLGCSVILLFYMTDSGRQLSKIGNELGIDLPTGADLEYRDTHASLGDGDTFAKAVYPSGSKGISPDFCGKNKNWHSLPLPSELSILVFGNETYGYGSERMKPAQKITHGLYFFEDRSMEEREQPGSLLGRASYNYTVALYDFDTRTLYFYKDDT